MTEVIKLTERLETVASFISPESYFADIGSDHAYLACYVCQQDKKTKAIAGEVSVGPFSSAEKTVALYGLRDVVTVKLGDGLEVIDEHVREVVIAGMGGSLISSILVNGQAKLTGVERLIIQPNNRENVVRETFIKLGYYLENEVIIEDNGRIYEILVAQRSNKVNHYDEQLPLEKQLLFGPLLMQDKSSVFQKKWQAEYKNIERIMKTIKQSEHNNDAKLTKFSGQLKWIEEVIS